MLADEELKTKTSGVKVALVKPAQADTSDIAEKNEPSDSDAVGESVVVPAVAAKPRTRPKVGRPASARKKKTETAPLQQESAQSEKPEKSGKTDKKTNTRKAKAEVAAVTKNDEPSVSAEKPLEIAVLDAGDDSTLELSRAERLRDELAKMDLTPEWEAVSPPPPWGFKAILLTVALFAAVSLSIMAIVNSNIKIKHAIPPVTHAEDHATPEQLGEGIPAPVKPPLPENNAASIPALPSPPTTPVVNSLPPIPPATQMAAPSIAEPPIKLTPPTEKADDTPSTTTLMDSVVPLPARLPAVSVVEDSAPEVSVPARVPKHKTAHSAPVASAQVPVISTPDATLTPEKTKDGQDLLSVIDKD
jgi:hypothetical protein